MIDRESQSLEQYSARAASNARSACRAPSARRPYPIARDGLPVTRPALIHLVCAARPNFMKVAPLYHALLGESWCESLIVHTGQHYDANMSDEFFTDLHLPPPDHHLG